MERNFMSKYIDCTMPFYDYMPVGNVWAWDVPARNQLPPMKRILMNYG